MCTLVGFPCTSVQIQVALAGLCTLSKDKKKDIELEKSMLKTTWKVLKE